jgi:hypothetical protein
MISGNILRTTLATLGGSLVGAILFGVAGSVSARILAGVVTGAPSGAFVGYGMARRWLGPTVVWVAVFGVAGLVLTGCDVEAPIAMLSGASFGAFLGLTGWWRGTLVVCATYLGGVIGAYARTGPFQADPLGAFLGAALGLWLAWLICYKAFSPKRAANNDLEPK